MAEKSRQRKTSGRSPRRQPPPTPASSSPPDDAPRRSGLLVVGIGASAGGLEALEEFFEAVPARSGLAFVVVSHQRPGQPSLLPELLGRRAAIPAVEATDGMRVEPDHLYLAAPGSNLSFDEGRLRFPEPGDGEPRVAMPVDFFFRSLAEDQGPNAVGIVLSGTGSDGTLGLKAIKGQAGLTLAQDATSARYAGMPQSAIAAGAVDFVRRPREMVGLLLSYAGRRLQAPTDNTQAWHRILWLLQEHSAVDFSAYKMGTALRRLERRMHVNQIATVGDYLRYLQANPNEVDALFGELLIGVTRFFRDPAAFGALAEALPALLDGRPAGSAVRVWVAGCSTGEEAYSIGIALHQYVVAARGAKLQVQIFATDVDPRAIEVARTGFYPAGIVNDVSPERLERFFLKEDAGYRVRKEIRDLVVFAVHNVIGDPPFSRLDLLSCRNLLIYLEAPAQERLLRLFHRALVPGGLLLLGPSESIEEARDLYTAMDRRWKLFRRADVPTPALDTFPAVGARVALREMPTMPPAARELTHSVAGLLQAMLLDRYAPASVVIDSRGAVVYIHGRTGDYLEPPPGRPSNLLLEMARPDLRGALAALLREATATQREVVRRGVAVRASGGSVRVDVTVRPLSESEALRRLVLVAFVPTGRAARSRGVSRSWAPPRGRGAELVEELRYTRERLQHSMEELQAANEELMSSNEELTSTNEELQSANEELETTKEEMQSLNEELQTVNAELQTKLDDLGEAHADLQNLLNSTEIATIFLNPDLTIKRFTPQARQVIHLIPADVGRPLADLVAPLAYESLLDDAREVLRTLTPCAREVRANDGTWYSMQIMPYRTMKDAIGGVVLTFVDVTRVKQAGALLSQARVYFENIFDTIRQPLIVLDAGLRVVSANRAFYRTFDLLPAEMDGRVLWEVAGGAWNTPALHEQIERVLPANATFEGIEAEAVFPRVGRKRMIMYGRRLEQEIGLPGRILLALEERPAG